MQIGIYISVMVRIKFNPVNLPLGKKAQENEKTSTDATKLISRTGLKSVLIPDTQIQSH